MASDTESSRRKHRRSSSDDEAEKFSKRHKHRHHHRHHRRRSKRHGEEDGEQSRDEIATPQRPDSPAPPAASVGNSSRIVDYDDVEEGEILEEEVSGGAGIKSVELGEQKSDSGNLGVHGHNSDNGFMKNSPVRDKFESEFTLPRDSRTLDENELLSRAELEADANGHLGHVYHKEDRKRHNKYGSPKRKIYHDVDAADGDEGKSSDWKKSSSTASHGDRQKIVVRSPSHERHHDGVRTRMRSMSHDIGRDRSPPHSVEEDGAHMKHGQHLERAQSDSDEERMSRHRRDVRHDGRGKERERSASYSRYLGGEDGDHDWDTRDSWEREMDRERRREKELERRRDREMERERRKEKEWDRKHESDTDRHIREKERERSLDWEVEKERRREMEWGRSGDRDRERTRESEWCRNRDRELDVEWRNEKERGSSRDREEDLYRKRQREREMSRDEDRSRFSTRERDRDRQREKERDRHRDRDMDRDRVRDHDRESERDRERRSDRNSNVGKVIKRDSLKVSRADSDSLEVDRDKLDRDVDEQHDFEERIALKLAEQEEDDDVNRIKEESRKRRQAILEKYKNQQSQQHSVPQPEDVGKVHEEPAEQPTLSLSAANITAYDTRTDGVDVDLKETLISVEKSPQENGAQAAASERASGAAGLGEGTPKSERSDGKYCDDIFGETPAGVRKLGKGEGLTIIRSGLHDNWDDAEGYYSYRFGEILDSRYEIAAAHGKGVFSTVVRAKDLKSSNGEPEEVAIKIIRNNETMHKAGQVEVQILQKLAGADPENRRHCVRFLSSFKYRNHLCLVFESLHMNLREVLKRFGRNIGLKLTAVRTYAKQLFIALKHLKNCGVLHCDIKPDNMLVNEAKNVLKLCDFGNAMFSGKNEITPYLVSRFYRAPEIILGLPYDHPMDMWSVGCCLYELYTGKVLFPGPTNNDMLRLHMELKGPFPKKMLKKGAFVDQHFDQDLNFHATEEDPVTKKIIKRMIVNIKPKDIGSIVKGSSGEDLKMLANFKDLLDKIFVLDPDKRMTVSQALAHPFITGK